MLSPVPLPPDEKDEKEAIEVYVTPPAQELQEYTPEHSWLCCTTYKDASKFRTVLQYIQLSDAQKRMIETRYLAILQSLQKRTRNHAIVFYIGHFVITLGSLLVPALLSIQNSDPAYALTTGAFHVHMYWATFTLSLLVTMGNAILTLFRIDKKYYFLNTVLERLRSEGWQYMSLTGRYSGHLTPGKTPTHDNQFIHFMHYVEKLKMKQIEEEYYRTDEKSQAPNAAPTVATGTTLPAVDWFVPSPNKPIPSMANMTMPEPVRTAYDTLVAQSGPLSQPQSQPSLGSSMVIPSVFQVPSPTAPFRDLRKKMEKATAAQATAAVADPAPK
jgi:uncharacterized membrane protein